RRPIVSPWQAHIDFSAAEIARGTIKLCYFLSGVRLVRLTSSQSPPLPIEALPFLRIFLVVRLHVRAHEISVLLSSLRRHLFNVLGVLFVPLDYGRSNPIGVVLPVLPTVCVSPFLILVVPISRLLPDSLGVFVVVLFLPSFQIDIVLFAVTSVVLFLLIFVTSKVVPLVFPLKLCASFAKLLLRLLVSTDSG